MRECINSEVYFQHDSTSDHFRNESLVLTKVFAKENFLRQRNTEVSAREEAGH